MGRTAGREELAVWGRCQHSFYRLIALGDLSTKQRKMGKLVQATDEFAGLVEPERAGQVAFTSDRECSKQEARSLFRIF
jgi:hypothetical protein